MYKYKQHVRPRDHAPLQRRPADELVGDLIEAAFVNSIGPVLIAVGGPGGTGKSTFARRLARRLGDAAVLRLDDYKTARAHRRQAGIFGAHPDANKMELIAEHLAAIKNGDAISKPVYDATIGAASASEATYSPARFNLIDGEVATYRCFRDMVDFSLFIDSDWRTQLATRLGRDLDDRDYSPEKAIATFLHSNLREFVAHGSESKNWADAHLFCHEDYRLELESLSQELYARVGQLLHADIEEVDLDGLIAPVLTPFAEDGQIDPRAFVEHLDWLAVAGVRRVLIGDVTGELFSLTGDERLELLKLALEYFPGLVLFQAGGGPLRETIDLARQAQELGAEAICCTRPIGWPDAPPEGLAEYLKQIAAAVEVPLILSGSDRHSPATEILDMSDFIRPGANAGPDCDDCDIATLKQLVRGKIESYPAAVRPPLSSLP
ncbi:MAG: dihydrodipicolinate synthase family protein [Phycisphaerae bacterium]|nr:dihydrodipicolinate synthase family protein [Phycisphaerae bacterium]